MTALFGRNIELTVESIFDGASSARGFTPIQKTTIKDVNIVFDIQADRTQGINTMEAEIYGLTEETRYNIRKKPASVVSLRFGYSEDDMFTLFKGALRSSKVEKEGAEIKTILQGADGQRARLPYFSKSYRKGWPVVSILVDLVESMGVDQGNLYTFNDYSEQGGLPLTLKRGYSAHGHAVDIFAKIMNSRGLEWSIQQETLQILRMGDAYRDGSAAPLLTPETGLLGVPTIDDKGIMSCQSLILPYISPGRIISVDSKFLGGKDNRATRKTDYKVIRCQYRGSLYSDSLIKIDGVRQRKAQA